MRLLKQYGKIVLKKKYGGKKYGKIVGENIVREEKVLEKNTGKINTRKKV